MPSLTENCACATAGSDIGPREFMRDAFAMLCAMRTSLASLAGSPATPVTAAHTQQTVAVGATSTTVLPAYAARQKGWVKNISDTAMTVFLGSPAVIGNPTLVEPGDVFIVPNLYTGIVTAIRAAGGGTFNVEAVDL